MAIRRGRVPPPAYVSTKGHSVLKQRSYATMPSRTPLSYVPRASSVAYDTRVDDYLLSDRVSNISFLSNSTLDESDDTVRRSRGRDQQLLRDATQAIVSSESYATPQSSVASRRVARGRSLAPRAASVPPRPLNPPEVALQTTLSKASTTNATAPQAPARARRPIIVYASPPPRRAEDRAKSVPPPSGVQSVSRARSVPPVLVLREERRQKVQVVPARDDWRNRARAGSLPPKVEPLPRYVRRHRAQRTRAAPIQAVPLEPLPTAGLKALKVPRRYLSRAAIRTGFSSLRGYGERKEEKPGIRKTVTRARVLASPVARATVGRVKGRPAPPRDFPKPKPAPIVESLRDFPKVYVPRKGSKPSNRSKAAIIASKLEPDPLKRRRPRSEFAANKYRSLRKEAQESVYSGPGQSTGLYASAPPLPKPSVRKAIRTDDGYSKPKNLLSWQYRLDSKMAPTDLLYQPSSFVRIREQVRDAQERMDRHRQMLDRYLPEGGADTGDVASVVLRKMADLEKRDPVSYRIGGGAENRRATVKIPSYYASGVDPSNPPMSDLRRRIRKTLNKTRYSAAY